MKDYTTPNNTTDIVLSNGLRTSVTDNEVVFHKPGDTITDNCSPNQVKLPFGMDLTNIGYTQTIPESLNTYSPSVNTYGGDSVLFQYMDTGVVVFQKDSPYLNPLFYISKNTNQLNLGTCSGNKGTVYVGGESLRLYAKENIKMFLDGSTKYNIDFSFTENEVKFKNISSLNPTTKDKEITVPYGTDLTNYNKTTFRQSLIEKFIVNNPNYGLDQLTVSDIKIYTPIKNLVGEDVFPKTSHTLLTVYYTSYIKDNIPQTTDTFYKSLIQYFCINDSKARFAIKVINSTNTDPLLAIFILHQNGNVYKNYTVTADAPKQVIDLTAVVSPEQKIKDAQFTLSTLCQHPKQYIHLIHIRRLTHFIIFN
jgi:hypothetical protein